MSEKMLNTRIQQKHDIEVNWSKAVNFIPKIGEVIVYDSDENHAAARVKIGDGVKTVVELAFIDDAAKAALFKEIDMVDEKVEALGQLVGDASIPEQIEEALLKTQADWEVNDETSAAYVKNRTHWEEINYGDVLFDGIVNVTASDEDGSVSGNFMMTKRIGHQPKCMMTIDGVSYEVYAGLDDPYLRLDCFNANFSVFANSSDELNAQLFAWDSFLSEGSHKVKIVEMIGESTIHQLDEKFIPDTIARVSDLAQLIENVSDEEIITALIESNLMLAVADADNSILTDENGNIIEW